MEDNNRKIEDNEKEKINVFKANLREEIKMKAKETNNVKNAKVYKGKNFKSGKKRKFNKEQNELKTVKCSYCNLDIDESIIDFHVESHPSKIFDWLYLGSYNNATNSKVRKKYSHI